MRRTVVEALESLERGRARLRVLVSERWLALATIPWSDALASGDVRLRESFVRDQLHAAGLAVALDDVVRTDDRSPFGEPRIALAYPSALIECLFGATRAIDARLESVQTLEMAAAESARAQVGRSILALALLDGEWLRFMHRGSGHWTAGQLCHEPALRDKAAAQIAVLWRRQQLREPALAAVDRLHALALDDESAQIPTGGDAGYALVQWQADPEGTVPTALRAVRGSSLEALASAPKRRFGAWLATAACLIVTAIAAVQTFQISAAAHAQELAARRQSAPPARPAQASWTREELSRVTAVNAAIRELNLPIGAVLRAVQPPRDIRVALLGIDLESGREAGSVKLSAESASGAEMARYVGYLAERPPLVRAYLVSHQLDEADPARRYRFTVEVAWRE